jgi:hypothetical protein
MNIGDINETLNQLYREGEQALADFAVLVNPQASDDETTDALLARLQQRGERFFAELRKQLQDQSQPWIAMLRAWAQLADGGSPAEMLLTPMTWWRPPEPDTAGAADASGQARVEAVASELAEARDELLQLLQQAADNAIGRFAIALRTGDSDQQPLRTLYLRWLEAAEAAYEDMLASEAFAKAGGRLTNAWSDLLLILQDNFDGLLAGAGLPTRRELTETQAQIHALRQQQRKSERQARAELASLRASLDALQKALEPERPKRKPRQPDPHET